MLHSNSDEQQFEELQNCLAPKIQSLQELYWNPLPIVWRPSFLRLLVTRKSFQHLLTKAYSLVPYPFRLNFLNAVIENRNDIPREILAILWHQSITEDRIQTNDELKKLVRLHLSASEKEFKMKHLGAILEKLPPHLTSPLLIDSATVCQLYCLAKKPAGKCFNIPFICKCIFTPALPHCSARRWKRTPKPLSPSVIPWLAREFPANS